MTLQEETGIHKRWTAYIPQNTAEKLKIAGMPIYKKEKEDLPPAEGAFSWKYNVTYADAHDWLAKKGLHFDLSPVFAGTGFDIIHWKASINRISSESHCELIQTQHLPGWHEAADTVITEAADILIKEKIPQTEQWKPKR